jgi:hypothetical protein
LEDRRWTDLGKYWDLFHYTESGRRENDETP